MKEILFVLFVLLPIDMVAETCFYGKSGAEVADPYKNNLTSATPSDRCVTFRYNDLNSFESERWLFLGEDVNNNGDKECFFIAKKDAGYGLVIVASDSEQRYNNQVKIPVAGEAVDSCTISVMFHDFDNDGTKEFIIAYVDKGMVIKGNVFRWHEPTKDDPICFINSGDFTFNAIPLVEGNTISSNTALTESKVLKYIYRDQTLEKADY